jgi:hypothetical protein
LAGQAVALLQVHHQVGLGLPADLGQRLHVLGAVHRHADEVPAGLADGLGLLHGGIHVLRARGAHALDGHGMGRPERRGADPDLAGGLRFISP